MVIPFDKEELLEYDKVADKVTDKVTDKLNQSQKLILELISANNEITIKEITGQLNMSDSGVRKI